MNRESTQQNKGWFRRAKDYAKSFFKKETAPKIQTGHMDLPEKAGPTIDLKAWWRKAKCGAEVIVDGVLHTRRRASRFGQGRYRPFGHDTFGTFSPLKDIRGKSVHRPMVTVLDRHGLPVNRWMKKRKFERMFA